jgi:hypothetical protein
MRQIPDLSTYQTSGTSTEQQNRRAHLGSNLVQSVGGAGSRLEQRGVDIGEVLDLEDSLGYSPVC